MKYPPFCDIILFSIVTSNEKEIGHTVKFIYDDLLKYLSKNAIIYKPQPSPIDKIKNTYRWRIILKCRFGNNIIDLINKVLYDFQENKKKTGNSNNSFVSVDVNPNSLV